MITVSCPTSCNKITVNGGEGADVLKVVSGTGMNLNSDAAGDLVWNSGTQTFGNSTGIDLRVTGFDFSKVTGYSTEAKFLTDFADWWNTHVTTDAIAKEVIIALQTTGFTFTGNSTSYTVSNGVFSSPKAYNGTTEISVTLSTITVDQVNAKFDNSNTTFLDGKFTFDEAMKYAQNFDTNAATNSITGS